MEFKKCLEVGHLYETKSLYILKNHKFKNITIDYKYNPYYDITAYKKKKKVYIEVKYNSLTDKTQKIFLECCKTNLNASGLSITQSHYYIFHSNTQYWICKTHKIKKLLNKVIRNRLEKTTNNITNEKICSYIEYYGIRTKNTIGILLEVEDIETICIYKGSNI